LLETYFSTGGKMMKKSLFFLLILAFMLSASYSQSLSQIGFILKKAIFDTENIVVLFPENLNDKIVKEAQTASLVTKTKFQVYKVKLKSEIPPLIFSINGLKKPAVIIIGDEGALHVESVKYIAQKLGPKNIPVISNRALDTKVGALLCIFQNGTELETHVNKAVAAALNITLTEEFLSGCVADVQ
jgi:hypothetical protein